MFDINDEYKPNEFDVDMLLSEMPLNLIKENIESQFEDVLEYGKRDHVTTFINMYKMSKDNANIYEDEELDKLEELRDDFYIFMQNMFKEYFDIGFPEFDNLSPDEQDDLIHFVYRFFIINIKQNFICFILNKIEANRDTYLDNVNKKKDITTISFKKDSIDPVDVYILSSLPTIIESILKSNIDIDDFLDNCDDDSSLETRFMKEGYDKFNITGNFTRKYIDMVNYDFLYHIESIVRNRILKKYQDSKFSIDEDDDV